MERTLANQNKQNGAKIQMYVNTENVKIQMEHFYSFFNNALWYVVEVPYCIGLRISDNAFLTDTPTMYYYPKA